MSRSYQGNGWMVAMALFFLFVLSQYLLNVRAKRRAGFPIDTRSIIGVVLIFLLFFGFALFQVLTHPW
jgi:hypothetical protein